jgi:hypothetical protein
LRNVDTDEDHFRWWMNEWGSTLRSIFIDITICETYNSIIMIISSYLKNIIFFLIFNKIFLTSKFQYRKIGFFIVVGFYFYTCWSMSFTT